MRERFTGSLILGESEWNLIVDVKGLSSLEEAEDLANRGEASLASKDGKPAVLVCHKGVNRYIGEEDCRLEVMRPEKLAQLGPPIDTRLPNAQELVLSTFGNPAYMVTEEDFMPAPYGLAELIERLGIGYKPDHLAYSACAEPMPAIA